MTPQAINSDAPPMLSATLTQEKIAPPASPLRVTLFTIPKPFEGHTGLIQRNALRSWLALGDRVEVLVGGDDAGVPEVAQQLGAKHLGPLQRSSYGTPRLDHLFERAHAEASGDLLMYVNADIVLFPDLLVTIDRLRLAGASDYLAIGRRIDLDYEQELDCAHPTWAESLRHEAQQRGAVAPTVCKDYFLFPRNLYRELPEFLVGRGNWDNWMVHQAKWSRIPVIDVTQQLTAVHQNHDYGHLKRGRLEAYVTGPEARHNEQVGGGKHVVSGASADWELDGSAIRKRRGGDWFRFARDFHRFIGLLGSFLTRR